MVFMKLPIYDLKGNVKAHVESGIFSAKVRPEIIRKAVVAERSNLRQPYGTDPLAGKRTSAHYHGRRGIKHSMMNREMARLKRIHGSGYLHFTARFAPQAVKGRAAHPPKVEKVWEKKINKKEKRKAVLSAIAATADRELVMSRGHRLNGVKHIPLVVENMLEEVKKTRDLMDALESFGLKEELSRVSEKKIRAGRGKSRGRKYARKKGLLVVVKDLKGIEMAGSGLPGVDVATVKALTVDMLAPGAHPGRLCIWTQSAVEELGKAG